MLPHRLRHVPIFPVLFNPGPGVRVEGYLHDCWWPGEVVEQHYRKGFRICFDDGDNAWLVRRNVRPMLRRAPEPGTWTLRGVSSVNGVSGRESQRLGVQGTPPLPPPPLRFPNELNPHVVIGTLRELIEGRDWATLSLATLTKEVEATLLPHQPSGWLASYRLSLVAALERALASQLLRPAPKRTKHRLLSPAAGRDTKRSRNAAYSRVGLLYRPLLRTQLPAGVSVVALATVLRGVRRMAASAEEATYLLQCIGPEVLFMPCTDEHDEHDDEL